MVAGVSAELGAALLKRLNLMGPEAPPSSLAYLPTQVQRLRLAAAQDAHALRPSASDGHSYSLAGQRHCGAVARDRRDSDPGRARSFAVSPQAPPSSPNVPAQGQWHQPGVPQDAHALRPAVSDGHALALAGRERRYGLAVARDCRESEPERARSFAVLPQMPKPPPLDFGACESPARSTGERSPVSSPSATPGREQHASMCTGSVVGVRLSRARKYSALSPSMSETSYADSEAFRLLSLPSGLTSYAVSEACSYEPKKGEEVDSRCVGYARGSVELTAQAAPVEPRLDLRQRCEALAQSNTQLAEENRRLVSSLERAVTREVERQDVIGGAEGLSSEGRLRAALARHGTTAAELRSAISAVEGLMEEARRELAAKELREQRAAYEQLHAAMKASDAAAVAAGPGMLAVAVAEARRAGVHAEDIERAEVRLEQLRSMTDEQRSALVLQKAQAEAKKHAYVLVKRDEAAQLRKLLDEADAQALHWQEWKDYAGRTLKVFAREARAVGVQQLLEERLDRRSNTGFAPEVADGTAAPTTPTKRPAPTSLDMSAEVVADGVFFERSLTPFMTPRATASGPGATELEGRGAPDEFTTASRPEASSRVARRATVSGPLLSDGVASPIPALRGGRRATLGGRDVAHAAAETWTEATVLELRVRAFRAVVKDDTAALAEVLERLPCETWSAWTNKGGKDMLTLSQERGSPDAYALMAKTLGLVRESKRESFEEGEHVWILEPGDVQAQHATVLEPAPAELPEGEEPEGDTILVEFWEGNGPPRRVSRPCVLKANS